MGVLVIAWTVDFHLRYRLKDLQKEYDTLKENDPAELQKAVSQTEVNGVFTVQFMLADSIF